MWNNWNSCYWTVIGPKEVCLGLARGVWVLDVMQERVHNMSPSDLEGTFIKGEGRGTKEGPRVEEARGKTLGRAALAV